MTDQQLEQRLRGWYRDEISEHEGAPAALRASVTAIPAQQQRPIWVPRRFTPMHPTRFAVAAVIGVLAVGAALYAIKPTQPPVGGPTPTINSSSRPTTGPAAGAPAWTSTEQMYNDAVSTATLLADGRVLTLGGALGSATFAELFDPSNQSWTATGKMNVDRTSRYGPFTATRLSDGNVLVAGGSDLDGGGYVNGGRTPMTGGSLAAAELYDPGTGTWTAVQPMTEARESFTATLLHSGKVLVAGGDRTNGIDVLQTLASAELYDPSTGSWTATGPMHSARSGHTATILADGKVLVMGGEGSGSQSPELYDPTTGSWTATGRMIESRIRDFTATLLTDGRVLVVGGIGGPTSDGSAELYDENTGAWTATGSPIDPRIGHAAALLPNGNVLVAGGMSNSGNPYPFGGPNSAELYDAGTGLWTATVPMREPREHFTATLLLDGRVLVAGSVRIAELYGPAIGP